MKFNEVASKKGLNFSMKISFPKENKQEQQPEKNFGKWMNSFFATLNQP